MFHGIEVHLMADIEKYKQGMAEAKKIGGESMGFIASIFDKLKSMAGGMWDSLKSVFSSIGDKSKGAFSSLSDSASSAFGKVISVLPGFNSAMSKTKDKMGETEEKSDSLIKKIGIGVVVAVTAAAAAIAVLVKKGLDADSALAGLAISSGITASQFSRFEATALKSGVTAQEFGASMVKLREKMKEAAASDGSTFFSKLGVDIVDANNALLKTDDVTIQVAKKIAAMSSEAEKYAAASKAGFEGKVQVLEDIARASDLSATTTDEQAAAVVRLGKIWHDILPGGKGMWAQVSTFLANSLTPAVTEASLTILNSKNTIVSAFNDIYGSGSKLPSFGEQIKEWGQSASQWFDKVAQSATAMTVSILKYVAIKTGLGDPSALGKGAAPAPVPGLVPLVGADNPSITKDSEKEYDALTKAIQQKIAVQKLEIQTGAALTEGQRLLLKMNADLSDGTITMTGTQKAKRIEELNLLIAQEKLNRQAQEARAKGDAAASKEVASLTTLVAAIKAKTAENEMEVATGLAATENQKFAIKLNLEEERSKKNLSGADLARLGALRAEAVAQLAANKIAEDAVKAQQTEKDVAKFISESTIARQESAAALAVEYQMAGKSADARELAMVAVKEQAALEKFLLQEKVAGKAVTDPELARLKDEAAARTLIQQATMAQTKALNYAAGLKLDNQKFAAESLADPKARADALLKIDADVWRERIQLAGAGTEAQKLLQSEFNTWYANQSTKVLLDVDVTRATEVLKILESIDAAARSAASGMADSFGRVGEAIGGLTTSLTGYAAQQQAIAAQLASSTSDAKGDPTKIAKAQQLAAQQGAQAQVKSYGDMASAAKGFFKENSAGYKVMQTTEKAFRAYEMALAVESMVKKIFFKETEVAANLTLNASKLTGEVVASTASTGLAATEASAWGITAVVKALASLPFPLNLAAGAATLAAVVAIGAKMFGGVGGGVDIAKGRQAATGVGSILGDSNTDIKKGALGAKSESIAHSLAIMEKNSGLGLAYSASMASSLRQVVAGIGGLGGLLVRNAGVTGSVAPDSYGAAQNLFNSTLGKIPLIGGILGKVGGGVLGSIFGGKTTTLDTGLTLSKATLDSIAGRGVSSSQYTDTKTSGGWFSSDKNSTALNGLGPEANDQFTKIILGLRDTVQSSATALGIGGDAFNARLNTFVVDLGKISLKDLKGEEIQKALEAAFSKLGDDMASFGVAGLEQYQAVGEGYLETLARVANDYMQVSDVLAVLGKSFNTTGLGAVALSESLIAAAGGLDSLTSGTSYFVENFLTEAERMAPITKSVNEAMGKLGQSGVTTVDQFKALVLAQDLNTAAGQAMYAQLIAIAEPFKKAADYAAELAAATGDFAAVAKTASEVASERRDLQQQLNELTKSETQLLAIQRAGIADVNRALFDQVQAAKAVVSAKDALAKAYDTESAAAKTALDKSKSWVTTLNGLNASMALGSQSTLTPEQKYAEARAQFEKTLAAANAGDTTAQSGLSAAEQAFLAASQVVNASDAKYVADYARVMAANDEALKWAGMQVDVQQASLDALTAQVSGLITINDSVLTVAQAIANLQAAMGTATGLGVQFDGSHAGGLASVPFDGYAAELHRGEVVVDAPAAAAMRRYFGGVPSQGGGNTDALVVEIKRLNEKIDKLNADANKNANAQIASNFDANKQAAKTVVAGIDKSTKASAWGKQPEYEK